MSIDKHFEKRGVELTDDNCLPQGQRTQKNVKRVIAAVRAAESDFNDELRDANERCRVAQDQVIQLQAELSKALNEVRKLMMQDRLDGMDLTTADKTKLLEVS